VESLRRPVRSGVRLIAAATHNPLDPMTFSGYSRHLFTALSAEGAEIVPMETRILRPADALRGAFDVRVLAGRLVGRRSGPVVRDAWYWSRGAFELLSARVARRLARLTDVDAIVQVGTHILPPSDGPAAYCVTDATVRQVAEAAEFGIGRVGPRVLAEAVEAQRAVLNRCRGVFVLSEWTARGIVDDYALDPDRITVVGAGANVPADGVRRAPDEPIVLFVGYDWERKGGPLLVEAFRIARRQVPRARLVVVGCTPEVSEPGVEVVGRLDRRRPEDVSRLVDLYSRASAFSILPTFDPFPNVLLEAAARGVPVVSIAGGSRPEAVIHGETGLLASGRDAAEVAELLVRLLADPTLVMQMGERAQRRARELYTWERVAQTVLDQILAAESAWDEPASEPELDGA